VKKKKRRKGNEIKTRRGTTSRLRPMTSRSERGRKKRKRLERREKKREREGEDKMRKAAAHDPKLCNLLMKKRRKKRETSSYSYLGIFPKLSRPPTKKRRERKGRTPREKSKKGRGKEIKRYKQCALAPVLHHCFT